MAMREDEVLEVFRRCGALLEGHFELRSGLHSARYFQCARVLQFPTVAGRLCAALVETMRGSVPGLADVRSVVAPAMGGILVGHEIARALDVASIFVEKENGVLRLRRFEIRPGERFIVAEDVITRGGRVQETIDIVTAHGGQVAAVATLVDRSGGQARFSAPLCSLLQMEPVNYEPARCPLCAQGVPLAHPGS